VVGSRGSVVPFFRKLAKETPCVLPITDARMTRFWITLEQGVGFVLSSLEMMRGGEIFVPKIPSSTIMDLAKLLAPDARHEIVGIRPGEKLHESLITGDDARNTVELDDRYVITPAFPFWTAEHLTPLGAEPVAEDFQYTSDDNDEPFSSADLAAMIAAAG